MVTAMEKELRQFLLLIAGKYAEAAKCGLSSVGRRCRKDSSFFTRISSGEGSFTARTFDDVIEWFETNWPPDSPRPDFKAILPAARAA